MRPISTNKILLPCLLAALTGCAVGPDFKRPDAPAASSYGKENAQPTAAVEAKFGESQKFDVNKDIPYAWWELFQSPQLDALIKRAFQTSPNVEAAQAVLRQAQEYTNAQQGFFYPTVAASYTASRNKVAGNMSNNVPGPQGDGSVLGNYYNFHVAQLSVGYAPDVFGMNKRLVESAEAQAEAQRMQLEATYLTLATNVVAAAIQEASLRAQIQAQLKIIDFNRQTLEIMRNQLQLGYISEADETQQEMNAALAQQALVPMQQQLEQTRNLLRALVGNTPDQDLEETFTLDSLHLPQELPLSLPSKLVEQRPDVRIAEAQLHYASAQYGVAIANTLPQFAVTGAIGGMASTPDWMFKSGGGFFGVSASVAQVIFDGGTLRAKSRAAQEGLNAAAAQYRSVVIAALQNVADALYVIQSDARALKEATAAAQAASKLSEMARKQFESGYSDYMSLLQAQQQEQFATINLVQAQTNRLGDTATLFQALGGGWWNRPGDKPKQQKADKN